MTIDPNKWIKTLPNNNLNDKSMKIMLTMKNGFQPFLKKII